MLLQTHFAPPERADGSELNSAISRITNNPIIDTLMTASYGLFAVLNAQRQIISINSSFLKLMGISNAEKVLGLRAGEYLNCVHSSEMPAGCGTSSSCSDCGAVIAQLAALETDEPQEGVCDLSVIKDGRQTEQSFQVKCCRSVIDDQVFLLMFMQDITPLKLKAYEELRYIIDSTSDGFLSADMDGRIIDSNRSFAALSGYSHDELTGMTIISAGVDIPLTGEKCSLECIAGKGSVAFATLLKTRDGKLVDVEACVTYSPLHAGRFYLFIRNIAERKLLEEQLRQAQKMEALGRLAGGVAHDFNNMLTVIIGYSNLLQMDKTLEEPSRERIGEILSAAEKAAQLTKSMLTFSRRQIMTLKRINLCDLLQQTQKFLVRIIGEDIQLKFLIKDTDLPVDADAGQIEQVLINLATNARDAMPDGGLLTIEAEIRSFDSPVEHFHGVAAAGRYACITVSDSGIGMERETCNRIFEPFFTTKDLGKGTGLGMSIIYGIIKQHNGCIHVYSEPGYGSTFRVYLPLSEQPSHAEVAPADQLPMFGSGETILLTEDDSAVRKLMSTVLIRFGYNVIEAVDGLEAVEKFSEHKETISLVLMDMIMPKLSGVEAYRLISELKPGVRVLYSSGYTASFIQDRDNPEENIELIMKPAQPSELLKRVREVLDR